MLYNYEWDKKVNWVPWSISIYWELNDPTHFMLGFHWGIVKYSTLNVLWRLKLRVSSYQFCLVKHLYSKSWPMQLQRPTWGQLRMAMLTFLPVLSEQLKFWPTHTEVAFMPEVEVWMFWPRITLKPRSQGIRVKGLAVFVRVTLSTPSWSDLPSLLTLRGFHIQANSTYSPKPCLRQG